ncbi:DUF742 domain-containing protein [Streptomyces sp. NPDC055815]
MNPPSPRGRGDGLVRPYVVTGGRSAASRNSFDLTTLVISHSGISRAPLTPEQRQVVELCLPGALSVAEVSGHLGLPLSVLRILLADLMDTGHITTRAPIPAAQRREKKLLEEVLRGLRAL